MGNDYLRALRESGFCFGLFMIGKESGNLDGS